MPLIQSELQATLQRIYLDPPTKIGKTMQVLADGYRDYAQKAGALGVPPVFTGLEVNAMREVLTQKFKKPRTGSPPSAALAYDLALQAFWTANPFVTLFPGSTALAYFPGILTLALTGTFTAAGTAQAVATSQAADMHLATINIAVIAVTFPGPLTVPLV